MLNVLFVPETAKNVSLKNHFSCRSLPFFISILPACKLFFKYSKRHLAQPFKSTTEWIALFLPRKFIFLLLSTHIALHAKPVAGKRISRQISPQRMQIKSHSASDNLESSKLLFFFVLENQTRIYLHFQDETNKFPLGWLVIQDCWLLLLLRTQKASVSEFIVFYGFKILDNFHKWFNLKRSY